MRSDVPANTNLSKPISNFKIIPERDTTSYISYLVSYICVPCAFGAGRPQGSPLRGWCPLFGETSVSPAVFMALYRRRVKNGPEKEAPSPARILLGQHRTMGTAGFGGSFVPSAQYEKWEIHPVFPHFSYFRLCQNLAPNLLAPLCGVALKKSVFFFWPYDYSGKRGTDCHTSVRAGLQ